MWLLQVLVVVCELSVAVAAHGTQFPDQEANVGPAHWELRVSDAGPLGKSLSGDSLLKKDLLSSSCYVGESRGLGREMTCLKSCR